VIERDRDCSKTTDDLAAWNAFGYTDTRVLDAALDWHARGFTPIPCKPRSKQAAIRWRHWQDRRPPRWQVRTWFWGYQRHNLAVLCGVAGLVVLDFDKRPEYFRWCRRCGIETFTTCTARGFHVYVRADNLPARSFALDGIDVKTTGYVLVPPSTHPTGAHYEVFADAEIARIADLADVLPELAELPVGTDLGYKAGYGRVRPPDPSPTHHLRVAESGGPPPPIPGSLRTGRGLIAQVKERLPILALVGRYTGLRPSDPTGRWYLGRCPHPAHKDVHASFWVDVIGQRCGCHAPSCPIHRYRGGLALDVVDFYACMSGLSLSEALRVLRREVGL